jgi:hypothetical protein
MLKCKQVAKPTPTPYATSADFCRIFQEEMNSLYLLSVLLTADGEKAEMCFVRSLEHAAGGTSVFKEWAHTWTRRTIIHNAIRVSDPRPAGGNPILNSTPACRSAAYLRAEIAAIVNLPAFERFVFVLSVFEHFSDHECSLLLSCTRHEVITARNRALRRIGDLRTFDEEEISVNISLEAGATAGSPECNQASRKVTY